DRLLVGDLLVLQLRPAEPERTSVVDQQAIDGHGALHHGRDLVIGDLERQGRQGESRGQRDRGRSPGGRGDGGVGQVARQGVERIARGDIFRRGALAPPPLVLLVFLLPVV